MHAVMVALLLLMGSYHTHSQTQGGEVSLPPGMQYPLFSSEEVQREVQRWEDLISTNLPAINAAMACDWSAVGIYDVRQLSSGHIGVGTITSYGFTMSHVYNPSTRMVIFSDVGVYKKEDRERFPIFFVRGYIPPEDKYLTVHVLREKDNAFLGCVGIPISRILIEKRSDVAK